MKRHRSATPSFQISPSARRVKLLAACFTALSLSAIDTPVFAKNGAGAIFPAAPIALPPAVPAQFDLTGFIESATLDTTGAICNPWDMRLAGGTITVNGIRVIVPCNTVLQMPATSLAWADLFIFNPFAGAGQWMPGQQTGLALTDNVPSPRPPLNAPEPSYEVHAIGNIIDGKYIAGLLYISQQSLNAGQGYINYIDYATGEIHVGGKPGKSSPQDIRIRINDPIGRYGKVHGGPGSNAEVIEPYFDPRFTADVDNPTIHAATGFPMCIPRYNPFTEGDDPLCPQINRPRSPSCKSLPAVLQGRPGFSPFVQPAAGELCTSFMMDPPPAANAAPCTTIGCPPNPTKQAPFEIGDYIDYAGTLLTDDSNPQDIHPYISAHTITAHLGIYTTPGRKPVYMAIEALLMGTNSLPFPNLPQETTSRVKVEGFTTDPSGLVDIYAVDVDPASGAEHSRLLGTESAALPPMIGRFRFQPAAGSFMPPTREFRVVSRTQCPTVNGTPDADYCLSMQAEVANGLLPGQYTAPVGEYIFAEGRLAGDPTIPANLQDFQFLYCGSGPVDQPTFMTSGSISTPLTGQLDPAPWAPPMQIPLFASSCPNAGPILPAAAPLVTVGANRIITPGQQVTVSATAVDPRGYALTSFNWTQTGGASVNYMKGGTAGAPSLSFTAPTTPAELTFTLQVTNSQGVSGSGTITLANVSDQVVVYSAAYSSKKGTLTVVANSDLPISTSGLQLYVQATNGTAKLASTPQALSKVANTVSAPTNCPVGITTCWSYTTTGVLIDPVTRFLVPPQQIIITSSKGGSATLFDTQITVR